MRERLGSFRLLQTIIHRPVEMSRELRDLTRGDERAHCRETLVPWRERRTQLQVMKQRLAGVLHDTRCDRADSLLDKGRAAPL